MFSSPVVPDVASFCFDAGLLSENTSSSAPIPILTKRRASASSLVGDFGLRLATTDAHGAQRRRFSSSPSFDDVDLKVANYQGSPLGMGVLRRMSSDEAELVGSPLKSVESIRRSTASDPEMDSRPLSGIRGVLNFDDRMMPLGLSPPLATLSPMNSPPVQAPQPLSTNINTTNTTTNSTKVATAAQTAAINTSMDTFIKRANLNQIPSGRFPRGRPMLQYHINPFSPEAQSKSMTGLPTPAPTPPSPSNKLICSPAAYRYGRVAALNQSMFSEETIPEAASFGSLYFQEMFAEPQKIGSGSFGTVYKCRHRVDGCIYAVKAMKKLSKAKKIRPEVFRDAYAMSVVSAGLHPNIVRYYTSWEDDLTVYVQCEYCESGSLAIMKNGEPQPALSEMELLDLLSQIAQGLHHIHSKGYAHLDIKPDNILRQSDGHYKIGDFGLMVNAEGTEVVSEGDSRYMALELLQNDLRRFDLRKADIFSLGATMFELASRSLLPARDSDWRRMRESPPPNLQQFSKEFNSLIQKMMSLDPAARPTALELVRHPIFASWDKMRASKLIEILQANNIAVPVHLLHSTPQT